MMLSTWIDIAIWSGCVLTVIGTLIAINELKKPKQVEIQSHFIFEKVAFTSSLLAFCYLLAWICNLRNIARYLIEWVIMVMRLTTLCWMICLFHHFSLLVPLKNHIQLTFYRWFCFIVPIFLSFFYFCFKSQHKSSSDILIQENGDFWIYHIIASILILFILRYYLTFVTHLKGYGFSKQFIRELTLKSSLLMCVTFIYWLFGILAYCSNYHDFTKITVMDIIYGFIATSFTFWIVSILVFIKNKKSTTSTLQQSLIESTDITIDPCEVKDLDIFVETYNCGEKFINDVDLHNYVPLNKDIYIFSLQECMNKNASISAITKYVSTMESEYLIESKSIGSTLKLFGYHGTITLIVVIKRQVVQRFNPSLPNKVYEGFGFDTFRCGNKGSVGIQIRLAKTCILIIASHFSSDLKGKSHLAKRCINVQHTFEEMAPEWLGLKGWNAEYMYHHTFIAGDLNFRISDGSIQNVFELITKGCKENNYKELLKEDELSNLIQSKELFANFKEAPIIFPPTFKLEKKDKGLCLDFSKLDNIKSVYKIIAADKTLRIPSWTDRILWYSLPDSDDRIEITDEYNMINSIVKSDHRPVYCSFKLHVKQNANTMINKQLKLTIKNLEYTSDEKEGIHYVKICCPLPCEDSKWQERQLQVLQDGFFVSYHSAKKSNCLASLETEIMNYSADNVIQHDIQAYQTFPIHAAIMIQVKEGYAQGVFTLEKECREKSFSMEVTVGTKKVGTLTGRYSLL